MTDTPSAPAPDPGLFARAVGVIFSPGATFRAVVANPRPTGILLLCCLLAGPATGLPQLNERVQQQLLETQLRSSAAFSGQPVSPEQEATMRAFLRYSPYVTMVGTFVFMPVFVLVFASLFWFVFNIVTHSQVIAVLSAVAAAPIILVQGITNQMGPFNLGALVPMLDAESFVARFLSAINVFLIWQLVVAAIGLSVLYRRKAGNVSIALVATYLIVAAAAIAAFSALRG
jgi:hypothetical protein